MPPLEFLTDTTYLGTTLLNWSLAFTAGLALVVVLQVARSLLRRRVITSDEARPFRLDDLLLTLLGATRTWALLAAGAYLAVLLLAIEPAVSLRLRQLFAILLLLQATLWGNRAIAYFADQYRRNEDLDGGRRTSLAALTFVSRLVLFSVLLLMVLDNLGLDITALIAGLGVGSIAVALALQGILGDLFASLSIVFDKPFEIGDFIVIDDMLGNVEHIGLRTTRIRSLSGEQLVFANTDLLGSRIRNYKRMAERRILFQVGVEYGTPGDLLRRIPGVVQELVSAIDDTRFDRCHFKGFGAYSLDFETVYYVLSADYNRFMDIQQELNLGLYSRFAELGIEFAFPTETMIIRSSPGSHPAFSG